MLKAAEPHSELAHTAALTESPSIRRDALDLVDAPRSATSPVTVELLNRSREGDWDNFVAGHAQGTLFHELGWKRAVERCFGHHPLYMLARSGDEVCGVCPLFLVESRLAGRMLVSVPYGIYGGPIASDPLAIDPLLRSVERMADRLGAGVVDLRSFSAVSDTTDGAAGSTGDATEHANKPLRSHWTAIDGYHTFRRELPTDPDKVAEWLPRKARAAARRASERHELEVDFDGDLDTVWSLYSRSMRRLGSINYPRTFFHELANQTAQKHIVQVVHCDGRPVAGLLTFIHGDTALPYFVGWDDRSDIYGLNNYLYFTLMQRVVEMGCRVFDFGRTRGDNLGSMGFKRFHGFDATPLAYTRYVRPGVEAADLSPTNPKFALARKVWPHLPLAMTRSLGGWLARSIPG